MVYDGVLLEAARARANRGLGMSKCPVCGSLIHVATEQFKFVVVEGGSCRVLDKAPTGGVCYLIHEQHVQEFERRIAKGIVPEKPSD
jgi:hypothetical protein